MVPRLERTCILVYLLAILGAAAGASSPAPEDEVKLELDTSSSGIFGFKQHLKKPAAPHGGGASTRRLAEGTLLFTATAGGVAIHQAIMHKDFWGAAVTTGKDKEVVPVVEKTVHTGRRSIPQEDPTAALLALFWSTWRKLLLLFLILVLLVAYCIGRRKARSSREVHFAEGASRDIDVEGSASPTVPRLHLMSISEKRESAMVSPMSVGSSARDLSYRHTSEPDPYDSWPDDIAHLLIRRACAAKDIAASTTSNDVPDSSFHRMMTEQTEGDPDGATDIEAIYNTPFSQLYRVMT